jgi:hypothetical protein
VEREARRSSVRNARPPVHTLLLGLKQLVIVVVLVVLDTSSRSLQKEFFISGAET